MASELIMLKPLTTRRMLLTALTVEHQTHTPTLPALQQYARGSRKQTVKLTASPWQRFLRCLPRMLSKSR
eukprot:6459160-Amphidinium_carterae.1